MQPEIILSTGCDYLEELPGDVDDHLGLLREIWQSDHEARAKAMQISSLRGVECWGLVQFGPVNEVSR